MRTLRKSRKLNRPGKDGNSPEMGKKLSEYAIRLEEKQKLKFNYGLTESQLFRYVKEARRRKAYAEGISISEKHVEFCFKKGFVVSFLNYKDINIHKCGNRYDGIIANGSMEHFVKPEEADQADQIYQNFFKICHSSLVSLLVMFFKRTYQGQSIGKRNLVP